VTAAPRRCGSVGARALAGAAIVLLTLAGCSGSKPAAAPPAATTVTPPARASKPSIAVVAGPFAVSGNKVLAGSGEQFVPYGFVLYCLAIPSVDCSKASAGNPSTDADKIRAAASFWHANVVRLQVAQERLFAGTGGTTNQVDPAYLAQLDSEVALAHQLKMVVILTLQEERFSGPPLPDATAIPFWDAMAHHYQGDPMAMFDIYNEPRLKSQDFPAGAAPTSADFPTSGAALQKTIWDLWKDGGTATVAGGANGQPTAYTFVGMQRILDGIRATGAQNIVVAEGNHGDHDLSGVAGLPKASGGQATYRLSGSNVVYGIEPDLNARPLGPIPAMQTPAQWDRVFGNLSKIVPIMSEAYQDWSPNGFCYPKSPTVVPMLLDYLQSLHMGLIAWTLSPGILIQGNDLQKPTTFDGITVQPCGQTFDPAGTTGPGADILQFFSRYSPQTG
ncbi:MAG: glycoside hydrolase family 5 protein, partial [Actinomycetota bacterium]|nr:glycoside hydrolase family 5 protein [Actinomycetota bacterium]